MIYSYRDVIPVVDPTAYIHPQATVIGKVTIGRDVYIGPGAVLRGDIGEIIIHDGANVQENCTLHMFPGATVVLEKYAHVGHGAVIHGARLGTNCLIGMNAVIMDDVSIGAESIVGALSFIKAKTSIPPRSLVVGNPARIIKQVSDEMVQWKTKGTELYQTFPAKYTAHCLETEPLRDVSKQKELPIEDYQHFLKS